MSGVRKRKYRCLVPAFDELDYVLSFNKGLAEHCVGKEGFTLRIIENKELSKRDLHFLDAMNIKGITPIVLMAVIIIL